MSMHLLFLIGNIGYSIIEEIKNGEKEKAIDETRMVVHLR